MNSPVVYIQYYFMRLIYCPEGMNQFDFPEMKTERRDWRANSRDQTLGQ